MTRSPLIMGPFVNAESSREQVARRFICLHIPVGSISSVRIEVFDTLLTVLLGFSSFVKGALVQRHIEDRRVNCSMHEMQINLVAHIDPGQLKTIHKLMVPSSNSAICFSG